MMWRTLIRYLTSEETWFQVSYKLHCMTTNVIIWNQARPIVQSNSNNKQVWTALYKVQVVKIVALPKWIPGVKSGFAKGDAESTIFSTQRLLQSVSSTFTPNAFSPCTQCSVFFCMHDSLQPSWISFSLWGWQNWHFLMALQPLDCRAVQCRLAVYPMALQPLNCRTVQRQVAEMPPETAHPIFPQCNRSRTAAITVRTVAMLPLAIRPTHNNL